MLKTKQQRELHLKPEGDKGCWAESLKNNPTSSPPIIVVLGLCWACFVGVYSWENYPPNNL